jgi:hypothetical protein
MQSDVAILWLGIVVSHVVGRVVIEQCCETVGCHYATEQPFEHGGQVLIWQFREVCGSHVVIRQCRETCDDCVVIRQCPETN